MIRSNAELQSLGIDRCRITGLSTEDTRFVFLYPECFQHSERRSTYRNNEKRNETFVAFVFDAVRLIEKYNALVGKDRIELDFLAGLIPDIRRRERAQAEIRKNNRWRGEAALKQLRKGMANPTKDGFIEILVPQAIHLTDCLGLVNANTDVPLQGEISQPRHTRTHAKQTTKKTKKKKMKGRVRWQSRNQTRIRTFTEVDLI